MNYETPKNETETLSADERKIGEMCRTLKQVEAPKDFDFKLKARIANSKAGDFAPRRRFIPAMRYALPALALILVLGLLAYNGGFLSPGNNSTIAGSSFAPQNTSQPQNDTVSSVAPPTTSTNANTTALPATQDSPKPDQVAIIQPKKASVETPRRPKENENGGSTDKSQKETPLLIPQFTPRSLPQVPQDEESTNPIPVREVLSVNGINAAFENGKWTVKSVTPNSLGDSSGIKENDVIEAIDDQPVSGTTVFNKIVSGKTITVTRNGQKSVIKLQNKQ